MANHPNRGPKGPSSNPEPAQVKAARAATGLTQTQAAAVVHSTIKAWQTWEDGTRRMPPGLWELFRIKTGQGDEMLKTDNAAVVNDQLLAHLVSGIKVCRQVMAEENRSEAEKQYFIGGLDALDMLARRFAESGIVDRKQFLEAVGVTA